MSGIPSWAVRGAKVVCICGFPDAEAAGVLAPQVGQIYTIRAIDHEPPFAVCFWLEEVGRGFKCSDGIEPSFYAGNFRPLTRQETDLAIFRAIADRAPSEFTELPSERLSPLKEDEDIEALAREALRAGGGS